jgi:hypothetical protein
MTLTITSLRVDERGTEVPFLIVNCCFTVEPDAYDGSLWAQAKGDSEEYRQMLTIDDPEKYETWLETAWGFNQFRYDGYSKAWTHQDPVWQYIEKFNACWFREWVADCPVTRAIIADLKHYKEHGKLPTVYRTIDEGIILQHLRTLQQYWD